MNTQTVTLDGPNGQANSVELDPIESDIGRMRDNSTNCVLVMAKKEGNGWKVLRTVGIWGRDVNVGCHFKHWHEADGDGNPTHTDKRQGATHHGIIYVEYPDLVDWLASRLVQSEEQA